MNRRPTAIRDAIDALICDISKLRGEVARLQRANEGLSAENEALRGENAALRADVAELRRQLDLDSSKQLEAAIERGVEEEAAPAGQRSRTLGQAERRTGRT